MIFLFVISYSSFWRIPRSKHAEHISKQADQVKSQNWYTDVLYHPDFRW